jgi:Fungalysin/Thermolysin Propeptide Motif
MNVYHGVSVLLAAGFITGVGLNAQDPGRARKAQHRETVMAPEQAAPQASARSFRLAAAPRDPVEVALDYVRGSAAAFGLTADDVADVAVASSLASAHNGVTHVYVSQRFKGIEVHGAATASCPTSPMRSREHRA